MAMLSVALPIFLPWPSFLGKMQLKGSMQKTRSTQAEVQEKHEGYI